MKNISFNGHDLSWEDGKYIAKDKKTGKTWESYDGENWILKSEIKIPKKVRCKINNGYGEIDFENSKLFCENNLTESQSKIVEVCDSIKDLLLYKNQKYGDSALNPNNIFYKGDATNSIKIRLDDKIGRIKNSQETRVNDVADIIGYGILLLVSMEVSKHEIENLKD